MGGEARGAAAGKGGRDKGEVGGEGDAPSFIVGGDACAAGEVETKEKECGVGGCVGGVGKVAGEALVPVCKSLRKKTGDTLCSCAWCFPKRQPYAQAAGLSLSEPAYGPHVPVKICVKILYREEGIL